MALSLVHGGGKRQNSPRKLHGTAKSDERGYFLLVHQEGGQHTRPLLARIEHAVVRVTRVVWFEAEPQPARTDRRNQRSDNSNDRRNNHHALELIRHPPLHADQLPKGTSRPLGGLWVSIRYPYERLAR